MVKAVRWLARLWCIVSIVLILLRFFSGTFSPSTMSGNQWIMFIFYPVGMIGGLVHGWRKEALGGSVAVFSLLAFYLVHFITYDIWQKDLFYLLVGVPGFLFLVAWMLSNDKRTS